MEREGLTEVTVEEYLSFDDTETNEEVTKTTQFDWRETTRKRCIQEVNNDVVEKQMNLLSKKVIKNSRKLKWWIALSR